MLDVVADRVAEDVQYDLANDEEAASEGEVAEGPSVLQGIDDEDDLHDEVHEDADGVDDVEDHEEARRVLWS